MAKQKENKKAFRCWYCGKIVQCVTCHGTFKNGDDARKAGEMFCTKCGAALSPLPPQDKKISSDKHEEIFNQMLKRYAEHPSRLKF